MRSVFLCILIKIELDLKVETGSTVELDEKGLTYIWCIDNCCV